MPVKAALGTAKRFAVTLFRELNRDHITDVAAMMTYYALIALFPMLVFLVTVTLLVLPPEIIQETVAMAARTLPAGIGEMVQSQVARMQATAAAGFAIGSALFALWGASRGTNALMNALNGMYDKRETRPWWRRQITAITTTLLITLLLLSLMAVLVVVPIALGAVADRPGIAAGLEAAWRIGRWVLAVALVMLVWAVLYSRLPNMRVPFRVLTPGAVVGVAMWFGVTQLFGLYVSNFPRFEATYGTLGGVIVFMLWLWLSNLALLFGAEINDVLADFRAGRSDAAAALAHRERPRHELSVPG